MTTHAQPSTGPCKQACLVGIVILLLATFSFGQTISLAPSVGPPTTTALVSGSGFTPNDAITISLEGNRLALAKTDPTGALTKVPIQVPASALPGQHAILAASRGGAIAHASFLVRTNWNQFHFTADHKGVNPYENVLSPATAPGLKLRWSYLVGSWIKSFSSPAVVNGILYFGSDDGNLYALNASTAALLWKYTTGSLVRSSPAVAGGIVYMAAWDGNVYALDAASGGLRWQFTTGGEIDAPLTVAESRVYVRSGDGYLYALNAITGALIWKASSFSVSIAVANGVVYFSSDIDYYVYALDAATGEFLWKYTTGESPAPPVVANHVLYFGSGYHVYALNTKTGDLIWKHLVEQPVNDQPAATDDVVYVPMGDTLLALDTRSGTLLWQYATIATLSAPAIANGLAYFGTYDGTFYILNATTGEFLWKYKTAFYIYTSPAVVNGIVYCSSSDGKLYAFN